MSRKQFLLAGLAAVLCICLVGCSFKISTIDDVKDFFQGDSETKESRPDTTNGTKPAVEATSVQIYGSNYVAVNETIQLRAAVTPANATDQDVIWTSSDPEVAEVDEDGAVTGIAYGWVTITAELAGNPGITASYEIQTRFYDVVNDSFAPGVFQSIYWAADNGITVGFDGGKYFAPDQNCSRQDFALFMYRALGKPEVSDADIQKLTKECSDAAKCPDAKKTALAWAYREGIISGSKGKIQPESNITREQLAIMMWRASGKPEVTDNDIIRLTFDDQKDFSEGGRKAITWAVREGVMKGFDDKTFRPDELCTRADIMLALYRRYR